MEWQFQINWPAIVCEAKQRRKKQKLTQGRLSTLAGVSTPTISRFENGEKDIQLSSVMQILQVLGMVDVRNLLFPEPNERVDYNRMVISFTGRDREKNIPCAVSREVLEDYFNGDNQESLKVFAANRDAIEHEIRRKYLAEKSEADGSIWLKTEDM